MQLFREVRCPIPATVHHPCRVDFEYERVGVANVFVFMEALGCWRRTSVRARKTKVDWAYEVRRLLEEDYPHAEKIRLECVHLNAHSYDALYEAFSPDVALSLSRRLEFVYTTKHGSWLNIAENELSVLTRQCVKGVRFELLESLRAALESWAWSRNGNQKGALAIYDCRCPNKTRFTVS